jgi:hypothetical protein
MSINTFINGIGTSLHIGGGRGSILNSTTCGADIGSASGDGATCIGFQAGKNARSGAVCIGRQAGNLNAGTNSVLIGNFAGTDSVNVYDNIVMLNNSGSQYNAGTNGSFYVSNIRRSDGTTYSRIVDYTASPDVSPKSFTATNAGAELTVGSFSILKDSSGISGEFFAPNFRVSSAGTSVAVTVGFRIYDQSNNIVNTFLANLPTVIGTGETANTAYQSAINKTPYSITANLYKNTTASPVVTYTIRAFIPTFAGAGTITFFLFDNSVVSEQELQYYFRANLLLINGTKLPRLYYDATTGELTYK